MVLECIQSQHNYDQIDYDKLLDHIKYDDLHSKFMEILKDSYIDVNKCDDFIEHYKK